MNIKEAAKKWGLAPVTVYKLIYQNLIPGVTIVDGHYTISNDATPQLRRQRGRKVVVQTEPQIQTQTKQ